MLKNLVSLLPLFKENHPIFIMQTLFFLKKKYENIDLMYIYMYEIKSGKKKTATHYIILNQKPATTCKL